MNRRDADGDGWTEGEKKPEKTVEMKEIEETQKDGVRHHNDPVLSFFFSSLSGFGTSPSNIPSVGS